MPFPSTISTFNIVNPTDRLNSPSHSALHNSVSSVLTQLQTVIGVEGANSVVGTLEYFIKSPASDGGGHIQSATKGGTGQNTFSKGDLLVATSPSVISRLAISSVTGYALVTDPNEASGIKWGPVISNKIAINVSSVGVSGGATSVATVIFSTSILGGSLGTTNAIKYTGEIQNLGVGINADLTLVVNYGNNKISQVLVTAAGNSTNSVVGLGGTITGIIANNGISSQIGYVNLNAFDNKAINTNIIRTFATGYGHGTASINSALDQNLVITAQYAGVTIANSILTGIFTVEKIA